MRRSRRKILDEIDASNLWFLSSSGLSADLWTRRAVTHSGQKTEPIWGFHTDREADLEGSPRESPLTVSRSFERVKAAREASGFEDFLQVLQRADLLVHCSLYRAAHQQAPDP